MPSRPSPVGHRPKSPIILLGSFSKPTSRSCRQQVSGVDFGGTSTTSDALPSCNGMRLLSIMRALPLLAVLSASCKLFAAPPADLQARVDALAAKGAGGVAAAWVDSDGTV